MSKLLRLQRSLPAPSWRLAVAGVWAIGLLVTGREVFSSYVQWTLQSLALGVLAIVATARKQGPARPSRYAVAAVLVLCLALWMPVKTFLFFGFALTVFYLVACAGVSLPFLSCAALLLSSPVFEYGITAFSFPIRLRLAAWVGQLFSLLGGGVEARGNVLWAPGFEFSVDPGCMGLHMLSVSLLLGIAFLGLLQKKWGRKLPLPVSVFFLLTLFVLNVLSNLLRIVLLVQFRVMPGTLMHEAIGLVCLLVYVCVPAALLARLLLRKKGIALAAPAAPATAHRRMPWLLLVLMTAALWRVCTADTYSACRSAARPLASYHSSWYIPGVLKLENEHALIYLKFIRGFYDTEHNPSMCWSGNGYSFQEGREEAIGGTTVFTARLVRGSETLYTAWWYSDGRTATTDQWVWRWNMLRGAGPYAVVNVTLADADALRQEVARLLHDHSLYPVIHP